MGAFSVKIQPVAVQRASQQVVLANVRWIIVETGGGGNTGLKLRR
jgi:hypothetical protein